MIAMCGAKARANGNQPCRQPSMSNGRCRLHGGKSTGPKTQAGRWKIKEANTKHGFYSKESIAERKKHRAELKASKGLLKDLESF